MHNYKEIDDLLVAGGNESLENNSVSACKHWLEAWEKIKLIMEEESLQDIEDAEKLYNWCDFMTNFVQDLIDELHNAGISEPQYLQKRIQFCHELIERTSDDWIKKDARRAIAETRFRIGEKDEAFRDFESIVQDFPSWAWGYLHWAGCYVWDTKPPNYEKAIEILETALKNTNLDGKADVCEVAKEYFDSMDNDSKVSSCGAKLQRLSGMVKSIEFDRAVKNIQKFNETYAKDEVICIREYRDKAVPLLLEFFAAATVEHKAAEEWHDDLAYHMYAAYLLAEFGVHEAFPLFVEILELDNDTCESILGEHLTDGMGSLLGSVAARDDIARIKDIIENAELNTYQRSAAVNALIVMCVRSIYERRELISYLGHLLDTYSDDYSFASCVVAYCHDVSAREHYPRILELYKEGALETFLISERDFEVDGQTKEEQEALKYFENRSYLCPVTDTIKSMSWWACFKDEERDKKRDAALKLFWDNDPMSKAYDKEKSKKKERAEIASRAQYISTPIVKESKVGRNEPCPCGSGKKYKKCCLNKNT